MANLLLYHDVVLRRLLSAARRHVTFDPRFAAFEAQRHLRGHAVRFAAAAEVARQMGGTQCAPPIELDRRGIAVIDPLLSPAQAGEVRAFLADRLVRDPYRRNGRFTAQAIPPETHVAHYDLDDIMACPHVMSAASSTAVLTAVEGYLGARPTIEAMRLWWSSPSTGAEHIELFHRDVDDVRFVKLFVYLTDVDEAAGPHVYVPGSHRDERLTDIRRFSDEEVGEVGEAETITGPAGTTFLADTYGIHRGLPPLERPRLAFQALYTLRPSIYGPRRPQRAWREGDGDPYATRLYLRHD